jgi:hypothetical protein
MNDAADLPAANDTEHSLTICRKKRKIEPIGTDVIYEFY